MIAKKESISPFSLSVMKVTLKQIELVEVIWDEGVFNEDPKEEEVESGLDLDQSGKPIVMRLGAVVEKPPRAPDLWGAWR